MSFIRDFVNAVLKSDDAAATSGTSSQPVVNSHPLADTHPQPGSVRQPQPAPPPIPPDPPPIGHGPPVRPAPGRPLDDTVRQQQASVKGKQTADSLPPPPPKPRKPVNDIPPQEMTDTQIAEHQQRVRDYKQPYHPSSGDGQPVTIKEALGELAKPGGSEVTLSSTHAQADLWEHMGKSPPPPEGFRFGGKIWLEEKRLTREQLQEYAKLDRARNPHRYKPIEEKGGQGGDPADGRKTGDAKKPAESKVSPEGQKIEQNIDDYQGRANKFKQQRDDFDKRNSDEQANKKQGQGNETAEQQLAKEADALEKESQALESEGAALTRELEGLPQGEGKGPSLKGAAGKLVEAVALVQGIAHILQADSPTDALKRTAEVEANLAEAALIQAVTKSNIVTAVVSVIIGMSSDQGSGTQARMAERAQQAAEEQMILKVTADFLAKEHPGSAEWSGSGPVIHDQKLWDATLAEVRRIVAQKKQEAAAASLATAKYHVQMLGHQDGMAGKREHEDEAGFGTHGGDDAFKARQKVLEDAYDAAYAEGDAKFQPTLQRARDLGAQDRMAGNRQEHRDEVATWYDFAADRLLEAYDQGYNQVAAGVGSETS